MQDITNVEGGMGETPAHLDTRLIKRHLRFSCSEAVAEPVVPDSSSAAVDEAETIAVSAGFEGAEAKQGARVSSLPRCDGERPYAELLPNAPRDPTAALSSDEELDKDDADWKPDDPTDKRSGAATKQARRGSIVAAALEAAETIKVYARVRPLSAEELDSGFTSCVQIENTSRPNAVSKKMEIVSGGPSGGGSEFTFAEVFRESSSQLQVFNTTAFPLVRKLFRAETALLFAYGMTNAGKTHTVQGKSGGSNAEQGIIPRAIHLIFASIAKGGRAGGGGAMFEREDSLVVDDLMGRVSPETRMEVEEEVQEREEDDNLDSSLIDLEEHYRYRVLVSYLEIYNEQCFDLLEEVVSKSGDSNEMNSNRTSKRTLTKKRLKKRSVLKLKEDAQGKPFVEGLTKTTVRSVQDVDLILAIGNHNRRVAETMANNNSSRSHTVFSITLERYDTRDAQPTATSSKFSIVDLAGSERTSRTEATGARLREAAAINKSLMNLSRCLEVLRENQKTLAAGRKKVNIVPYRQSKLTRLFQENFEAGSAVMIAAISPCSRDADETIHGLRCSVVAQQVKVANFNTLSARDAIQNAWSKASHSAEDAMEQQMLILKQFLADEKRRAEELERENSLLRTKLADAESRVVMVEAETREEAAEFMEIEIERLTNMHADQIHRLTEAHEESTAVRVGLITRTARKAIRQGVLSTRRRAPDDRCDETVDNLAAHFAGQRLNFDSPKQVEVDRITDDSSLDDTLDFGSTQGNESKQYSPTVSAE